VRFANMVYVEIDTIFLFHSLWVPNLSGYAYQEALSFVRAGTAIVDVRAAF
jgi:hypothetical protein